MKNILNCILLLLLCIGCEDGLTNPMMHTDTNDVSLSRGRDTHSHIHKKFIQLSINKETNVYTTDFILPLQHQAH